MNVDLGLAASNITAALISSGAVPVKDINSAEHIKKAVNLYSQVLTELINQDRQGNLYQAP
jgi:hypothetical protein